MLGPDGDAQFFEHVRRHRVGAQANQHAALASSRRRPRCPRRCSCWTEGYARPRFASRPGCPVPGGSHARNVRRCCAGPGCRTYSTVPPRAGSAASGVILVALRLGDVDVEARAQLVAESRGLLQRGVLEREAAWRPKRALLIEGDESSRCCSLAWRMKQTFSSRPSLAMRAPSRSESS